MAGFITVGFLIVQFSRELPDASRIQGLELKVPLRVFSADKLLISEFGNERRKPLAYEDIPQTLIDSVLASEDDGFFEHGGIDVGKDHRHQHTRVQWPPVLPDMAKPVVDKAELTAVKL